MKGDLRVSAYDRLPKPPFPALPVLSSLAEPALSALAGLHDELEDRPVRMSPELAAVVESLNGALPTRD